MSTQPANSLWAHMQQQQQQTWTPIKYVPASRKHAMRSHSVIQIVVAAHTPKPSEAGDVQHWVIYLRTGQESSVCLNIQPSYTVPAQHEANGSKADLIVSELPCAVSGDAVQTMALAPLSSSTTVDAVMELLESAGREKYEFTSRGTGCRRWIRDTILLLAEVGMVSSHDAETAVPYIERIWPHNQPSPIPHGGSYYA